MPAMAERPARLGGFLSRLMLASLVALPAASAQQVKVRTRDSTAVRDSSDFRIVINGAAIQRLVSELLSSRAMEETIAHSLREAAGERQDPRRLEELQAELGRIARKNASLISAIELRCAREDAPPEGYLGVTFSDVSISRKDNEPAIYEFGDRPVIYSVDPGSPAAAAGIRNGDVLVAVGGQDARRPIALSSLLKPGSRVVVRVTRDGQPRDFAVLVGKRPVTFGGPCANVEDMIAPERSAPMIFYRTPAPGAPPRPPRTTGMAAAPVAPEAPEGLPAPPAWGLLPGLASGSLVAGARLTPVDDDWRELVGVDKGLVVTDVSPGSPAREAGLRKGDVIVSVDDTPVSSVRVLQRALSISESRSVRLQVVRKGKAQAITLRWQ
jgi:C-terminal processing protease CtpA/Prc